MTAGSVITPELKALLNKPGKPLVFDVEKGHIRFFARAIGDDNPLFTNEEYAAQSRYKSLIAPPLFLVDACFFPFVEYVLQFNPLKANINGGSEIEYFLPVKVGDKITGVPQVIALEEKEGRSGRLLLVKVELTLTNQNNERVSRTVNTFIWR